MESFTRIISATPIPFSRAKNDTVMASETKTEKSTPLLLLLLLFFLQPQIDKTWSTGEKNGKPFLQSCPENLINGMKRQKDMTLKSELPRSVGAQYATDDWNNSSKRNEVVGLQLLSCIQHFATPWTVAHQGSLFFNISWSLLKLMSFESVMPSNHLILCCSLLLLPSIFPSIRVFSNELAIHIRWPSIGTSASASVLTMNIPLGLTSLISLNGLASDQTIGREHSSTHLQKIGLKIY